jgi:hypothetical protein
VITVPAYFNDSQRQACANCPLFRCHRFLPETDLGVLVGNVVDRRLVMQEESPGWR